MPDMGKRGKLEWNEFNTDPMMPRPKPPSAKAPSPAASAPLRNPPNPGPTLDQRWQRTVRFNWDKGGSKGGRK